MTDHEAAIIEAARKLAELDLSDDPEAAEKAAEVLEGAQAALRAIWAVRSVLDAERGR